MGYFSLYDAHPDGYGYDSAPQSLLSLITPEYGPPAFDYSNGLCYLQPRMASMVYCHGLGRYCWGSEYQHYEYPFRPPYITPYIGKGATDTLECWYNSLTTACVSVRSCFIALGAKWTYINGNRHIRIGRVRQLMNSVWGSIGHGCVELVK
eukprot:6179991-Pleurochrysis_carterae.AAC.1